MCNVFERKGNLGWISPERNRGFGVKPKTSKTKSRHTSTNPIVPRFQSLLSQNKAHFLLKNGLGSVNYIFFEKRR